MPGLNAVINVNKLALFPPPITRHFSRQSVTFTIGLTIGCSHNRDNRHRDNRVIVQSVKLYSFELLHVSHPSIFSLVALSSSFLLRMPTSFLFTMHFQ